MSRGQRQAPGRYDDIVTATVDLITEHGVGRLRAADIAKQLGVSTGLIFYHFENLENLVERAFAAAAERDLANLQKALTVVDGKPHSIRLREVLREYGPTGTATGWRLWNESWSAGLREPDLRKVIQGLDIRWRQTVAQIVAEGVGAGEFHTPDVQGAAWRLTSLLDGLAVQAVALDGAISADEIHRWMDAAIDMELGTSVSGS